MLGDSSLMAANGNGPMMRRGVGGNIKNIIPYPFAVFKGRFISLPMISDKAYKISGITKDSVGAVLGSCIVELFYTATDISAAKVSSDATTGAYSFSIGPNLSCYIVAYKAGSPDVMGTTVNTLTAA